MTAPPAARAMQGLSNRRAPVRRDTQGRRHGFESGGGTILRAERAKKILCVFDL